MKVRLGQDADSFEMVHFSGLLMFGLNRYCQIKANISQVLASVGFRFGAILFSNLNYGLGDLSFNRLGGDWGMWNITKNNGGF